MRHLLPLTTCFVSLLSLSASLPSNRKVFDRSTDGQQLGYIDVAVATVWTNPSKPRPVDSPALTNPVELKKWLDSMSVAQYLNLTSADRTQTQALYGTLVYVLDYRDGWYELAVSGQPTPKNSLGYPGWVPAAQISLDGGYGKLAAGKPFVQVDKVAISPLYRDEELTDKFIDITYNTRLPLLNETGSAVQVAVPGGGSAFLSATDVSIYNTTSEIPYPSGKDLVTTAMMFLHRPYLWGGMSGYAFDCSGFTHTIYDGHGILIPRDSTAQASYTGHGTNVSRSDLAPGDLIYYASNLSDPATIYHVAMYAGGGKMAEAYDAGTPVRITPVRFNDDYWGAQRFLKQ